EIRSMKSRACCFVDMRENVCHSLIVCIGKTKPLCIWPHMLASPRIEHRLAIRVFGPDDRPGLRVGLQAWLIADLQDAQAKIILQHGKEAGLLEMTAFEGNAFQKRFQHGDVAFGSEGRGQGPWG